VRGRGRHLSVVPAAVADEVAGGRCTHRPPAESYGAWYLVIVGGLAVAATLIASRGLWGFAADRFDWSLLPVGYRVRHPHG
jgi:hypothetical protein